MHVFIPDREGLFGLVLRVALNTLFFFLSNLTEKKRRFTSLSYIFLNTLFKKFPTECNLILLFSKIWTIKVYASETENFVFIANTLSIRTLNFWLLILQVLKFHFLFVRQFFITLGFSRQKADCILISDVEYYIFSQIVRSEIKTKKLNE